MKAVIATLLLAISGGASAATCHYFWSTDCFEIRDASRRDITHHVLLSSDVYSLAVDAPQCDAGALGLSVDHMGEVLKRFNRTLKKLDGCDTLDSLSPVVFSEGVSASAKWRRLQRARDFKQVHVIRRLPED